MDELKEAWKQIKDETSGFSAVDKGQLKEAIYKNSKGPLENIRKKVFIKWLFCLFFTLVIAVGIPFIDVLISQILLSILLTAYIIGSVLLLQEHNWLKRNLDMSENVKSGIKAYYERIRKVLRYEELIGLTLYPISLTAGFFLGLKLGGSGEELVMSSKRWIALIISLVLLTPLAHLLTRWMNQLSFGKYLKQLKQNLEELDKE